MVETEAHFGQGDSPPPPQPQPSNPSNLPSQNVPLRWNQLMEVITSRKVDFATWLTRLFTIAFGLLYLIPLPIFGNVSSYYYKAFLASAATSALRLHQRLDRPALTQQFFASLMMEDSCHYLFYSLIFVYSQPITLALMPIELFAILHFASFTLSLLDALGRNNAWIGRLFISIVELQTITILRMAAATEIMLFVFTVIYTLAGKASLLTPFVYYRFLTLRYASRRNHYTRTMFGELRIQFEHLSRSPKCPAMISNLINKGIILVSKFAPPLPPVQQN